MSTEIHEIDLDAFVIVGDRVLIQPKTEDSKTKSGLFLPPGVQENEKIQSGYVLKTGPGYAVAPPNEDDIWQSTRKEPQYIPLQAEYGDEAIFLSSQCFEIKYKEQKYLIVPHSAILMLIRDTII